MKIGLTGGLIKRKGATWEDAYNHAVWLGEFGDKAGFNNLWFVEHHFTEGGTASPSIVISHLAAITKRIRLGYSVALLPFHHPLRIAEEMLLLDRVSNGRLDMGIGRGHAPIEVNNLCIAPDKGVEMFNDSFAVLRSAFLGQPFSLDGEYWKFSRVQLFPPPVQMGGSFYMPITSERSIRFAAQHEIAPLLGSRPFAELRDTIQAYEKEARAAGLPEARVNALMDRVAITRVAAVADTFKEAEDQIRLNCAQYHESFKMYSLPVGDAGFKYEIQEWPPLDTPTDDLVYKRGIFGTRDDIVDQLRELEKIGVRQVSINMESRATTIPDGQARFERFAREVLPFTHNVRLAA